MTLHDGQSVLEAGKPLAEARAAMILLHGRGASAQSILALSPELSQADFAYLAPQAAGNTWYPLSFLAPIKQNEPKLSSALALVDSVVNHVKAAGIPAERVMLLGFSQGACLTLEYVARHPQRLGGVIAFTGGLVGPEGTPRDYEGSLDGTPVFIGTSDPDPHVPVSRVQESADVLTKMGANVTLKIYPGMAHTINQEEIDFAKQMMQSI